MPNSVVNADDYDAAADMRASVEFAYEAIRARVAAGGPGWGGYPVEALPLPVDSFSPEADRCPKTG